ncbi:MAG TPA: AraC family transcriptional regulator [Bryobacteraceae bacterium]|nr:AraC family transcriptional regulator [Bryobacteraceae bacterium]
MRQEFRGEILRARRIANFRLVAVSYAPNQVLPRHSHEHAYVSVALRGAYLEQLGRSSWECAAGGTIFHNAGECHQNRFFKTGAGLLVLEIDGPFLIDLADRGIATDRQSASNSSYCMHLAARLNRVLSESDPVSALCAEGLSMELLSEALRPFRKRRRGSPDWLSRVREILRDRYRENVSLTELAGEVQVHPVHLARTFRERYQCCVGDFVRQLRVDAACRELLRSDAPIAEIAACTGFTDQSHLSRILKRYAGVSPGEFRRLRRA